MLLCGIDLGTSSIKVSIVDASNQKLIHSVSFPEEENEIISVQPGFAEQSPEHWWYCIKEGIKKLILQINIILKILKALAFLIKCMD